MNAASWTVCLPKTRSDFADDEFRRKRYSDCVSAKTRRPRDAPVNDKPQLAQLRLYFQ